MSSYIIWTDQEVANINGTPPPPGDLDTPLIANSENPANVKLATIKEEIVRLERLISADAAIRNQYAALSARIAQENNALKTFEERLTDAQGATTRRKTSKLSAKPPTVACSTRSLVNKTF